MGAWTLYTLVPPPVWVDRRRARYRTCCCYRRAMSCWAVTGCMHKHHSQNLLDLLSLSLHSAPTLTQFVSEIATLRFYTFFSGRHERHGFQTAQATALGNTAIFLAERKTCVALYTTAVRTLVISSGPVVALLTLLKFHSCDCYYIGSYVLLMKSIVAHIHVEVGLLRWPPQKKQTHMRSFLSCFDSFTP